MYNSLSLTVCLPGSITLRTPAKRPYVFPVPGSDPMSKFSGLFDVFAISNP